jgi:hypothetical protein
MKRKVSLTIILLLVGYAAYVHGYYQDNGGKLFLYSFLELFPLWNIGAYMFWPAYFAISLIKPFTDLWQPWMIVGMWVVIHMIYALGVSWMVVDLIFPNIRGRVIKGKGVGYKNGEEKSQLKRNPANN